MIGAIKSVYNYSEGKGLAFHFRQRRAKLIKELISRLAASHNKPLRILDVGGTEMFWRAVGYEYLEDTGVHITLLNLTQAPVERTDLFESMAGDACELPFENNSFDLCFSNSVIEHVGDFRRMMMFAEEVRRVAPSYYCQTPNFWFPIEPHFFFPGYQFLPEPVRVWLNRRFTLGHHKKVPDVKDAYLSVQSARLLDRTAFSALFDDARIERESFLLLSKSLIAIREVS
ncbi:MAG TPA: class I SAM-dependent methyltransferase [Alphaproteobacteria bacterium]|nr:class I SAM-dependent methyltransferase [Alphaproteobacteria bacterium]